jgi:hypothetical protein
VKEKSLEYLSLWPINKGARVEATGLVKRRDIQGGSASACTNK